VSIKRVTKSKQQADALEERSRQARQAYELRQQGLSWWEVAERIGISETMAMKRVDEAISMASQLVDEYTKQTMLVMEVSRLDALQYAYWGDAVEGDVRAAEFVLKVAAQRAKLLGLDNLQQAAQTVNTVIVQGTSSEYIEALRGASKQVEA
jgi:hypothetical protein